MIDRIRKFQILNNQLFSIIHKYMTAGKDMSVVDMATIDHCTPPQPEGPLPDNYPALEMRDGRGSDSYIDRQTVYSDYYDDDEYQDDPDQEGHGDVTTGAARSRMSVIDGSTKEHTEA